METTGTLVPLPADFEEPMDFRDIWVPETEMPSPAVMVLPLALMVLPEMVMLVPAVNLSCFPACNAEMLLSQVPMRDGVVDESL